MSDGKEVCNSGHQFFYQGDRRDDADLFHQSVRDSR